MSKIKLFVPAITLISKTGDTVTSRTICKEPVSSHLEAYGDAERAKENYRAYKRLDNGQHEKDEQGNNIPDGYTGSVIDVVCSVHDFIIDVDDFEEYKPVYEVELRIVQTKLITVEIDSANHGEVEDDYDAGQKAKELFEDGDFDDELEYATIDETEVEVDYTSEL